MSFGFSITRSGFFLSSFLFYSFNLFNRFCLLNKITCLFILHPIVLGFIFKYFSLFSGPFFLFSDFLGFLLTRPLSVIFLIGFTIFFPTYFFTSFSFLGLYLALLFFFCILAMLSYLSIYIWIIIKLSNYKYPILKTKAVYLSKSDICRIILVSKIISCFSIKIRWNAWLSNIIVSTSHLSSILFVEGWITY